MTVPPNVQRENAKNRGPNRLKSLRRLAIAELLLGIAMIIFMLPFLGAMVAFEGSNNPTTGASNNTTTVGMARHAMAQHGPEWSGIGDFDSEREFDMGDFDNLITGAFTTVDFDNSTAGASNMTDFDNAIATTAGTTIADVEASSNPTTGPSTKATTGASTNATGASNNTTGASAMVSFDNATTAPSNNATTGPSNSATTAASAMAFFGASRYAVTGASGFVTGIIAIFSGGLGICAFRRGICCPKCLVGSHFFLCIVASVLDVTLIYFCIAAILELQENNAKLLEWIHRYDQALNLGWNQEYDHALKMTRILLSFAWLTSFAMIFHMLCSIASMAFVLRNRFCGRETEVSVTYLANRSKEESGAVAIPVQSETGFLASNASQGKR